MNRTTCEYNTLKTLDSVGTSPGNHWRYFFTVRGARRYQSHLHDMLNIESKVDRVGLNSKLCGNDVKSVFSKLNITHAFIVRFMVSLP